MSRYRCGFARVLVAVAAGVLVCAATPSQAQSAAAGSGHTVILKSDSTVWTVGHDGYGQLGDNDTTNKPAIAQVSGLTDIVAVASGVVHTMAITSTGSLYVWGDNTYGQVGDGTPTMRKTPVQSTLTNVIAIAAGDYHSIALTSNAMSTFGVATTRARWATEPRAARTRPRQPC